MKEDLFQGAQTLMIKKPFYLYSDLLRRLFNVELRFKRKECAKINHLYLFCCMIHLTSTKVRLWITTYENIQIRFRVNYCIMFPESDRKIYIIGRYFGN
jgi:hypothetical protein